ncbi:MAG TPA: aquaporin [Candidatus Dormibacteraeota bacterium]|nr:aquaporin [Candidatus Dormibacteraeota bacterium]
MAEFAGTTILLIAVVGSGIMAQRLSPGDVGLQLLENSTATAAALVAIILAAGPVSGGHLNPVVSLADRLFGGLTWWDTVAYWVAQVLGGLMGTVIANLMFGLPALEVSSKVRFGPRVVARRSRGHPRLGVRDHGTATQNEANKDQSPLSCAGPNSSPPQFDLGRAPRRSS